ncbi:hypothetical protein AVEN_117729-1 [Araneus ventricosus]|uniref:Uncharacterized protein n=1 Tax=Araneus ventricosus TaxID=182803 RepID=A0A4Y1ZNJ5_ARAVE|nr:hypothetical protein AVEN_258507-1 [Araneus ventricosus]GBL60151.1 hypothetical protein AVEN_274383-1 [Araneus ventricosus]GBL60178.1 hypothetical protein AVEN_24682-1 [Araneus ventricosus]GBL60282.1 hypothetical protein AVEN_117729-1 [Araneus ventricosus]
MLYTKRAILTIGLIIFIPFQSNKRAFWPTNFEPWTDDEDPPSPKLPHHTKEGRLTHDDRHNLHQAHIHDGTSVESGFDTSCPGIFGTLIPRSRDLPPGSLGPHPILAV